VRQVKAKVALGISKLWLSIRSCTETYVGRVDVKIPAKTPAQQSSADHKLIARLGKLESCRSLSLIRIEQREQTAGFFFPCDLVNLPYMHFIVRQVTIGTQQTIWLHRLRYHGQGEAAK
jgi:hypothetical protein